MAPTPLPADLRPDRPAPEARPGGYPVLVLDRERPRALLRARQFDSLQSWLSAYSDSAASDIRWEDHAVAAYDAFQGPDRDIGPLVLEWLAGAPGASAPHLALAEDLLARREEVVGGDLDNHTAEEAGDAYLGHALDEAEAAVRQDPDNVAAHAVLLRILEIYRRSGRAVRALARALDRFPLSYEIRYQAIMGARRAAGGSREAVDSLVQEAQVYADRNPRLRALLGLPLHADALRSWRARRYAEAVARLTEADAFGEEPRRALLRAQILLEAGDPVGALLAADRAVAWMPDSGLALHVRAQALVGTARQKVPVELRVPLLEAADRDYQDALRIRPATSSLQQWAAWTADRKEDCIRWPRRCLGVWPFNTIEFDPETGEPRGTGWKVVAFVVGLPVTVWYVLVRSRELGLGPTPIIAFGILVVSFIEWARQRFWAPRLVHVMAGIAFAVIWAINVMWARAGGAMWTQRFVVAVVCVMVPYLVYLLAMGPHFIGRKRPGRWDPDG